MIELINLINSFRLTKKVHKNKKNVSKDKLNDSEYL